VKQAWSDISEEGESVKKLLGILIATFVVLTTPAGKNIWIVRESVVAVIIPGFGECSKDAYAIVVTGAGKFCVAESPEDVFNKVSGK
jgi:hypothetical protein